METSQRSRSLSLLRAARCLPRAILQPSIFRVSGSRFSNPKRCPTPRRDSSAVQPRPASLSLLGFRECCIDDPVPLRRRAGLRGIDSVAGPSRSRCSKSTSIFGCFMVTAGLAQPDPIAPAVQMVLVFTSPVERLPGRAFSSLPVDLDRQGSCWRGSFSNVRVSVAHASNSARVTFKVETLVFKLGTRTPATLLLLLEGRRLLPRGAEVDRCLSSRTDPEAVFGRACHGRGMHTV